MARLGTILDQIDSGSMLLPEFQRGYVWNKDQIRGLMRSLYKGFPVGALLVWEADGGQQAVRGAESTSGTRQLLLDGQQRITTLYGIVRGRPPAFFEGDPAIFTRLYFNVETESFQFLAPSTARADLLWVDVTALFNADQTKKYDQLIDQQWMRPNLGVYLSRLLQLESILERDFFVDRITGADKTVDVVVDIFNRVNSGGTKLSKGDLALARICAEWGGARPSMRQALEGWKQRQFTFSLDWLLRNVNAVATGKAPFAALEGVSADEFRVALDHAAQNVDHFLGLVGGRLGIDHDRVISSGRYAFPIITRLLHNGQGRFVDGAEADKALYWFVHAALRGRFAGAAETALAKDLDIVDKSGVDGLIAALQRSRRGGLTVEPQDLEGVGRGARAYSLLYMLTRVSGGRDLGTGGLLDGESGELHVHEVFPKDQLYRHGYSRSEANAVGNLAFAVSATATTLNRRSPHEYLVFCSAEALASQWIPADPELWRVENYRQFLDARRRLVAADANAFLGRLVGAEVAWTQGLRQVRVVEDTDERDARAVQIRDLLTELDAAGYATPALDAEITDPETSRALAVAEAYWPEGLQAGQGSPVVLELDPDEADLPRLAELGFEVFTSVDALRGYVQRRNEIAAGDRDDEGTGTPGVALVERPSGQPEQLELLEAESGQLELRTEAPPSVEGPSDEVDGVEARRVEAAGVGRPDVGAQDVQAPAPVTTPPPRRAEPGTTSSPEIPVPGCADGRPPAIGSEVAPEPERRRAESLLEARLVNALDVCKGELKHNPRPFVSLLVEHGPVEAVRHAVARPASDAFVFLWERDRLDLSVEAVMLDDDVAGLFTDEERSAARKRLVEFGYEPERARA